MNREILTRIANRALNSGQMIANYPDPDNSKVTFPPSPYYRFLRLLADEMNSKLSVELGVCGGGGSLHLAMGSQIAVGIDVTYDEYMDNVKWLSKNYDNLYLFTDDSVEFAPYIYERFGKVQIDILFIDTTHTYARTLDEYNAYLPYLSNRAVVILDDLFRPGMDLAWDEMPEPKIRFDFLHPSQSPTDGGFGVIWKQG
jgi:predicted O-methyltransferase YrrM